jgi:hypothetical protein
MDVDSERRQICVDRSRDWLRAIADYFLGTDNYGVPERVYSLGSKVFHLKGEHNTREKMLTPRAMFDSWFAYHIGVEGLLKSTLTVQWLNRGDLRLRRIRETVLRIKKSPFIYISQHALHVLEGRRQEELVKDHVVPVAAMKCELQSQKDFSEQSIRSYLEGRYRLGFITQRENERFSPRHCGENLIASMPRGWEGSNNFARYTHPKVRIRDDES